MKTKKTNHIAFYINGKRVSRERIQLEAYIERHNLWRKAFLKALIKKSRKGAAAIAIIIILLALYSVFNNKEDQTPIIEKTNAYEVKKEALYKTQTTKIKWGGRSYNVTLWGDRVREMKARGYSDTKILDLLTILNMECGRYDGKCFNWNDVGPFQINKIHREQFKRSWELYNDGGKLFLYQLSYANKLLNGYENRFCSPSIFKQIGKKYSTKAHWTCIAYSYNGHPRFKYAYAKLWWERRKILSKMLFN